MPSYKLSYFDARGLGDPIRQLFHLAGVQFEDEKHIFDEFQKYKSNYPFRQLPVLTVDGLEIPQSAAISRYLARKFGYAGKTPEEEAWVDAIVDQFKDFLVAFKAMMMAGVGEKSKEEIEKVAEEVFNPGRDAYFKILNGLLEKSKSGFLVGDGLTWADLMVVENLVTLENLGHFSGEDQPRLAAFKEKVHSVEKLKEYFANRKKSQY